MKLSAFLTGVLVLVSCLSVFPPAAAEGGFKPNIRVNQSIEFERNVPAITVGWDGAVYTAWQDKSTGSWRIMLAQASASGASFSSHTQVATSPPAGSIEQSPDIGHWNGTVYVVWQDNRNNPGGSDIYFSSVPMPAGVPSIERKINDERWPGGRLSPALAVAPNGTIYVAYTNESKQIRMVASYDGGTSWTPSALVSGSNVNTRGEQRAAVDPHGKVYVVWRDGRSGMINRQGGVQVEDDDVYIASSDDGGRTFGPDTPVNDVVTGKVQSSPSIAIDGYGVVHVAWKDERFATNEVTDIFYSKSSDGTNFGQNIAVNDTSPVAMAPKRTNHQQPWIAVEPTGTTIYIVWVDDRGLNHNVYLAKSEDSGATFHPAHTGPMGNVFIDDVASYNGIWDIGEAILVDNGNGFLDAGLLNGSPDQLTTQGRANLRDDTAGDFLRYHDANLSGSWDPDEDIFMNGPGDNYPLVHPDSLTPWDDSGYTVFQISLLQFTDNLTMSIGPGRTLSVGSFNTVGAVPEPFDPTKIGLNPGDSISGASLEIVYRANSTYTGTANVNWSLESDVNQTWFPPSDTGDVRVAMSLDLFSLGVNNVTDLRDMNVSFSNNGAGSVSFDRITLNVTKGVEDTYDTLDVIVYNGTNITSLGDPLRNFTSTDNIVYIDVDITGRYDTGDPLIQTALPVGTSGILRPNDRVLRRSGGQPWRTLYNPFPLNDDAGGISHFMPRVLLNPFNYVTTVWQDWRRGIGPDIYSGTARTDDNFGPWTAFWIEADQRRAGPGGNLNYRILARNIGELTAANISIKNTLPPEFEFVQSNPAPDQIMADGPVWDLGSLPTLTQTQVNVVVRVNGSAPMNSILETHATLNFTDQSGTQMPDKYAAMAFTTSDMDPPVIVHTPQQSVGAGGDLLITATVTDDSGVATVRLLVKPIGADYFNSVDMTRVGATDQFEVTINVGQRSGTLSYYIEAVDTLDNVGRDPSNAPTLVHQVTVTGGTTECTDDCFPLLPVTIAILLVVIVITIFIIEIRRKKKHRIEEGETVELEEEQGEGDQEGPKAIE